MRKLNLITASSHQNKEILRKKCKPIQSITSRHKNKIRQMVDLMYKSGGMGLAAPQCGWHRNVFVMNTTQRPGDELIFINPKIIGKSEDVVELPEGCLSLPGVIGVVDRPRKVTVEALDIDGRLFKLTDAAWGARCMQHEIDHLSGVLFIDRAKKLYKGEDTL